MSDLPPAIVLGIDSPIGLSVVRELGRRGVPVHGIGRSPGAIGAHSRWIAEASVRGGGPLASWLPALVARTGARALFAVSESDLLDLARLDPVIAGCRILTPRAKPLATVLDKSATLAAARPLGIDIPDSWQPVRGEDFAARAARLTYPVVVKWADPAAIHDRLAAARLAFVKADYARDPATLLALLDRYRPLGAWPLVQGYCRGSGLGQMLYMEDGRATLRFQHRRLHEWPPEGGVSTLCAAEPLDRHAAQMVRSEALLAAIGWEGPAMVEYRHDPATGRYWLMEINGRFWGSLPLARACRAEFAWEGYRREILGERGPAPAPAPAPRGNLRARYMIPETRRLARLLRSRGASADPFFTPRRWGDLASYAAGFLDPRMRYYVFDATDPGPFLADISAGLRKLPLPGRPRATVAPHVRSA